MGDVDFWISFFGKVSCTVDYIELFSTFSTPSNWEIRVDSMSVNSFVSIKFSEIKKFDLTGMNPFCVDVCSF